MNYREMAEGLPELELGSGGAVMLNPSDEEPDAAPTLPALRPTSFDYGDVSSTLIEEAEATADRIRKRTLTNAIETGKDLLVMKRKLGHGMFIPWLRAQFDMSERTAQYFMSTAEKFGATPQILDMVPRGLIYEMAAVSTPEEVRQAVMQQIDAGTKPDLAELKKLIADGKEVERRKKREERERQAAEREKRTWKKKESALRKSGANQTEINSAKKDWSTKKVQKEGKQQKKVTAKERLEEASRREREELSKQEEERKQLAGQAVDMLKSRLGADFDIFRDLISKCTGGYLQLALEAA